MTKRKKEPYRFPVEAQAFADAMDRVIKKRQPVILDTSQSFRGTAEATTPDPEPDEGYIEVRGVPQPLDAEPEKVNHPQHYGGDTTYEAIKVIEAWGLGFCLGNTVKYISRAGKKAAEAELDDLRKAAWYLERRIQQLEDGQ